MNNFIVVEANQSYEHIEEIVYVENFDTKEQAQIYIENINIEQAASFQIRKKYIEDWVDAIEIPETDYHGWIDFYSQYIFRNTYVFPKDFKNELKNCLINGYGYVKGNKFENYNPPKKCRFSNLFIVSIKD